MPTISERLTTMAEQLEGMLEAPEDGDPGDDIDVSDLLLLVQALRDLAAEVAAQSGGQLQ